MISLLKEVNWILSNQFGINLPKFCRALPRLLKFSLDTAHYLIHVKPIIKSKFYLKPCLHDYAEEAGDIDNEYFWQDLVVAKKVHAMMPDRHLDVGSRLDGFIAHVSLFTNVQCIDIRPISTSIPNVQFIQCDICDYENVSSIIMKYGECDSMSCLHALEHMGLGRYGDTISGSAVKQSIANMTMFLRRGGKLYLSTPLGFPAVYYNANYIFEPKKLITYASSVGLDLESLTVLSSSNRNINDLGLEHKLEVLSTEKYNLVLLEFIKK